MQIFDWAKAATKPVSFQTAHEIPAPVDAQQADVATYTKAVGSSISKFQTDLSNSVTVSGGFNFFSGSISAEFNSQSLQKSENEFTRIQQSISLWSLRLAVTAGLRKYLRDDFMGELDGLPLTEAAAKQFFDRYGSHFLTGVVMGGRAVLASATNKLTLNSSDSIEVVAKASYDGLTGQLSAEDKLKYKQSLESFRYSSDTNHFVVGGDGVKAAAAFDGDNGFLAWKESISSSPDFIDFVTANPMAEIWSLCKTTEQAAFLKEYYNETWAPNQSARLQRNANYIDDMVVITGDSSTIPPPSGYTKLPYDLNAGSGGDYIYLCYHEEPFRAVGGNKPCITDIKIIYDQQPTPEGYVKLPQDLNKGAHGKFVYLCYRRAPYVNEAAIKDVTVIMGKDADVPPPYSFVKVPGDLNAGAHGEFINVCYSLAN